jgi:acyl carrier protein
MTPAAKFGYRMTRDDIVRGLRDLLTRQEQVKVDVSAIAEDTRIDRIGFDSISILDFIYDVEDRFGVQTEIADLVTMERVGDLIDYLEARLVG